MTVRFLFLFAALLALPCQAAPRFAESALAIHSGGDILHFTVERAETPDQQAYGLMHRKDLPTGHGMLFDMQRERRIVMWMKNTLVPLDMLFIDRTGRILTIRAEAKPLSEARITTDSPARAVLELPGGEAARRGIQVGDTVDDPIFRL